MERPDFVPETDWDAEKKTFKPEFGQKVKDAFAFKAEQDVRAATLPKDPAAYTLDLPADFKPPEGVKFEFNKDDPALAAARAAAVELKLDQAGFSKMLGIYASKAIADANLINTARNAEIAKLGSAGPQRIDAIKTWAQAKLGPELGAAMEQMLVTAKHVEGFEKIINLFSNQGGTQFDQRGREQQEPQGKIPDYEKMTFEQRRIAQMNQKAAAGGGR